MKKAHVIAKMAIVIAVAKKGNLALVKIAIVKGMTKMKKMSAMVKKKAVLVATKIANAMAKDKVMKIVNAMVKDNATKNVLAMENATANNALVKMKEKNVLVMDRNMTKALNILTLQDKFKPILKISGVMQLKI